MKNYARLNFLEQCRETTHSVKLTQNTWKHLENRAEFDATNFKFEEFFFRGSTTIPSVL